MVQAIIALGSNLAQPQQNIELAAARLAQCDKIHRLVLSSLYQTTPVGYTQQPDFINAVAWIDTDYAPHELLRQLQNVEQEFGRERSFPNAPRTLDLDIIDYNQIIINDADLCLPHPRACERGFVMHPLAEIAPDYQIGSQGKAADIAARLTWLGIKKLPSNQNDEVSL